MNQNLNTALGKTEEIRTPIITRSKSKKRSDQKKDVKFYAASNLEESNDSLPKFKNVELSGGHETKKIKNSNLKENDSKHEKIAACKTTKIPKADLKRKGSEMDSLCISPKSCEDIAFQELKVKTSELFYKDAVEELPLDGKTDVTKIRGNKEFKNLLIDMDERGQDAEEARRQEKIINNVYDVIRQTAGLLFKMEPSSETTLLNKKKKIQIDLLPSIQNYYDRTIQDISKVWADAICLVTSVKDHTITYVDEKSKLIDREQLALEAEILQLAIDFAVNYSKLKTDFLLKAVKNHLQLKEPKKTELEHFMDSKLMVAAYTEEDLITMAHTVKELKASVLKEEDDQLE